MTKQTTIQDVAKLAGVSAMTVSRVLNGTSKVAEATRERVLAAVKQLDYRPNVSARRLAGSRSFMIGLMYDNPSEGYVSRFLLGALKHCRQRGYHLIVEHCGEQEGSPVERLQQLLAEVRVDSLILLPPLCDDNSLLAELKSRKLPFVRIAPDRDLTAGPFVCMDDYEAAFTLTSHLIERGHKAIGHIIGHPNQGASRLRYQGYLDAMRSHGLETPPQFIKQGFFTYRSGMEAAQELLGLEQPPSAIFASNDDMAAAVVAEAHRRGLAVPESLSVVGFDDTQIATAIWPQLTTVRQPITEMAEQAVELLAGNHYPNSDSLSELRHVLEFALIERDSSGQHDKD
ncbi:LacI family DNA-binding transcriptional regulator [Ferrimonas marina]|uniref:Transcriptional regulator, LacI family n=1 Tax=Ferrimonas marina TaxID=299255 RepID=A0A1M5NDS0_9GAMM|nr:LacI family DNA-binding transcriptional regulator [Ferrimonas marina]SHG87605.1 transcriptional regulator, LacI family [Ferrimonas marina]